MSHICFNHNPFGGAFKCNLDYCTDLRAVSLGVYRAPFPRAIKMNPLALSDWPKNPPCIHVQWIFHNNKPKVLSMKLNALFTSRGCELRSSLETSTASPTSAINI